MTDLTVKLDDATLHKLVEAAQRVGLTPERLAETTLASLLQEDEASARAGEGGGICEPAGVWAGEAYQTTTADFEGPFVELDNALDAFSSELERRLAGRSG